MKLNLPSIWRWIMRERLEYTPKNKVHKYNKDIWINIIGVFMGASIANYTMTYFGVPFELSTFILSIIFGFIIAGLLSLESIIEGLNESDDKKKRC
jgi:uncharacterized membrane protein